MTSRTWLITGVSSGFGRELTSQLLERGDRVIGTVRDTTKIADLTERYPDTFLPEVLEMTDPAAVRHLVDRTFDQLVRVDPSSATPATACSVPPKNCRTARSSTSSRPTRPGPSH
jgi:NADP-dependent 3-hydroxy acid dehydrogenase YdfG